MAILLPSYWKVVFSLNLSKTDHKKIFAKTYNNHFHQIYIFIKVLEQL